MNIRQKDKKNLTDCMGHILRRNYHLKHNIEYSKMERWKGQEDKEEEQRSYLIS